MQHIGAAGIYPPAGQMTPMTEKQGWAKYKLPVFLAFFALALYGFSIFWMIQSRGGA